MFHVDNNSAVPVMPAVKPVVSAVTSFFTEGGNGVPPTYPGPDWFNIIQSELLAVLAAAGITPDKANNVQLLAAMRALFLDTSQNGADIQDKALFLQNLGLDIALNGKQTRDATLTNLSGKDVASLLQYLTLSNAVRIGDYGVGGSGGKYWTYNGGGFYAFNESDTPTPGISGSVVHHVVSGYGVDLYSPLAGVSRLFCRNMVSNVGAPWAEFYSNVNTTKAADGTLKAASPVVKIFHDGHAETNDESEGCTVTRKYTGEYLIEGCIGLNADAAWGGIDGGFDIPKDRNRQPLIWLDYEVNPDGSVLVKTYHRTHPDAPEFARNEINGFVGGDPIDIPIDQFVSVRVEMPANSIYNKRMEAVQKDLVQNEHDHKQDAESA